MLIITGLGRCGSSLLTKFLKEVGYNVGMVKWDDKMDAGMEDVNVSRLNRALYVIIQDKNIQDPKLFFPAVSEVIKSYDMPIVKDPHFTWSPGLIECWKLVRSDLKVLFLHRKFEDIIKSRERISKLNLGSKDVKRGSDLSKYKADFADFIAKLIELKIPFQTLLFPYFTANYSLVYSKLSIFGIGFDYQIGQEKWNKIVDFDKVHIR